MLQQMHITSVNSFPQLHFECIHGKLPKPKGQFSQKKQANILHFLTGYSLHMQYQLFCIPMTFRLKFINIAFAHQNFVDHFFTTWKGQKA